jgi:hypothetical protein
MAGSLPERSRSHRYAGSSASGTRLSYKRWLTLGIQPAKDKQSLANSTLRQKLQETKPGVEFLPFPKSKKSKRKPRLKVFCRLY